MSVVRHQRLWWIAAALLGAAGCCSALHYVDRRVECPDLYPPSLVLALQGLPGWEVTPAPPMGPDRSFSWDVSEGEVLLDVFCRRGKRTIHVALYFEPPSSREGTLALTMYTQWYGGMREDMRALYHDLRFRCDGLPDWDSMEEQAHGSGERPSPAGLLWIPAGFLLVVLACLVIAGFAANAVRRSSPRMGLHLH